MIATPSILTTDPVAYAAIHQRIPVAEIAAVIGPTCAEIGRELHAQSIPPYGPWFTHHFVRPLEFFDFEVCFPVAQPIQSAGRVHPGLWPATRVAQTTFHGGYAGLPAAWGELEHWIHVQSLSPGTEFWEVYQVGPSDTANPHDWITELDWPLIDSV